MKQIIRVLGAMLLICMSQSLIAQTSNSRGKSTKKDSSTTVGNTAKMDALMSDPEVLTKNIDDNKMEVQMSNLAFRKATRPRIKTIAQTLATDHTQALRDLLALAASTKLIPVSKSGMDTTTSYNTAHSDLTNLSGSAFENKWMEEMLAGHKAKLAELNNAINTVKNQQLKQALVKMVPVIRMHITMLAQTDDQQKGTSPGGLNANSPEGTPSRAPSR